ncbi:hypothetical protein KPATCC21470_7302 [Kitasatospora purpeofusca]
MAGTVAAQVPGSDRDLGRDGGERVERPEEAGRTPARPHPRPRGDDGRRRPRLRSPAPPISMFDDGEASTSVTPL